MDVGAQQCCSIGLRRETACLSDGCFHPLLTRAQKLRAEVEGQWTETYGYVIYITEVISCGKGKVQEETGHALFVVKFTAQVSPAAIEGARGCR